MNQNRKLVTLSNEIIYNTKMVYNYYGKDTDKILKNSKYMIETYARV